jgi:nitronate monooxygenase
VALLKSACLPTTNETLPIGVGFINWGADLSNAMPLIREYKPAAVWFFAPSSLTSLSEWVFKSREVSPNTRVWIQVGSVKETKDVVLTTQPDVLVVQGTDAGGHGLAQGASLISLVPEVHDILSSLFANSLKKPILIAAGGIMDSRSTLAALVLGSSGICMGTRFLATPEAKISKGYKNHVLTASDGGQSTVRTKVYDNLRGTIGWAGSHNARGIVNKSYWDHVQGMSEDENKMLYQKEMEKGDAGWGDEARMTAYAGSGVGLVRELKGAGEIVKEIREGVQRLVGDVQSLL